MSVEYVDFGFDETETSKPLNSEFNRLSFIEAYQEAFKKSVYNEDFSYEEVDDILSWYNENADFEGLVALDDEEIVGFSVGFRLDPEFDNEEWREKKGFENVPDNYFDGNTFYYAELGLEGDYRGNDIGEKMASEVFERIDEDESFSRILIRTNEENPVKSMYKDMDFRVLDGLTTEVEQERSSGEIETDTRIWLEREIT